MILISQNFQKLWNGSEIRVLVLLSLSLQILLVFFAIFRKRSGNRALSFLLWASYLGADYIATLALGNLLSKQTQDQSSNQGTNGDLLALWAPFLLLHLGGPDAITSYSLEDNELWLRHLLGFVVQVSTAVLAFLSSLPNPGLWQPAIVVFISGIWKFGERSWALRSASMDELRESMVTDAGPGPNYVNFMQMYLSCLEAGLRAHVVTAEKEPPPRQPLSEIESKEDIHDPTEVTFEAYRLFTTFKRVSANLMLSFQDRIESQHFFFARSARQAFKVVEIELSFLYDILHTKATLVHCISGRAIRFLVLCTTVSAALLFHTTRNHHFNKTDIAITYVLFCAAVCLEIVSIVLLLLSDWTIVMLRQKKFLWCAKFVQRLVDFFLPKGKKRWSNSMRQYNLFSFCLMDHKMTNFKRVMKILRLKEPWDNYWQIDCREVPDWLKKFIFEELKEKAKTAEGPEDYMRLRACRGEWVLRRKGSNQFFWSVEREYDESILLWHIATDLLLHSAEANGVDSDRLHSTGTENNGIATDSLLSTETENGGITTGSTKIFPEICALISNYMLYLLVMQPSMLPAGIGKIRFQDTCAEAKWFFSTKTTAGNKKDACNTVLTVNVEVINPTDVKGDRIKSVLFDACRLARLLQNDVEENKRWKIISAVWVEMLCYAACNCRSYFHAKQLRLGGELLTHVWLMMVHMGIGEQYRIETGHGIAKLIVEK